MIKAQSTVSLSVDALDLLKDEPFNHEEGECGCHFERILVVHEPRNKVEREWMPSLGTRLKGKVPFHAWPWMWTVYHE